MPAAESVNGVHENPDRQHQLPGVQEWLAERAPAVLVVLRLDRPPADVVEQLRQLAAALDAWPTDAATDLDGFRRAFAQHLDERIAPDVCLLTRRSTS